MRRSPSRYCAELARLTCLLTLAGLSSATGVAAAGEPGLCPVYEKRYAAPTASECAEPGVTAPAAAPVPAGAGIVPLPAPPRQATPTASAAEALLALPKLPGGTLPTDFELGPDAVIAESYWSPVLCSTIARVTGPPGSTLAALVPQVPAAGTVVENTRYVTAAVRLRPAPEPGSPDPHLGLQYGLAQSGAPAARAITNGTGARVALLDSAPDPAHPELEGIRLESLGDVAAPTPAAHGTLMAGVISARENNGFGIAGVAPGADLLAIPVCRPEASLADSCGLYSLLRGIDRAFEVEAHVVNLSLVGPANELLERAVDRLDGLGVVVVAAAGNEGTSDPRYPAAYPSVVGVGAVDANRAAFARGNSGPSVELTAPGVAVLSTVPGASFAFGDGTSLAAAHVSGVLALLVASGSTPLDARTALFEAGNALPSAVGLATPLAPVCDALERLGSPCTP
ncbi:MAG: S8 family serine peptidase [Myxococcales bacterium]|nr:S8 family serine peptidase [Myxococcales bacterium]